jgi:hypothetical protein
LQGASGSGAGYLEKYLTGLTAGNTLTLTIGAAGVGSTHTAGGSSTLASGTQTITTLTASGGAAAGGSAGTGTNGDINITGTKGISNGGVSGVTGMAMSFGGQGSSANGTIGGCVIEWLS